MADDRMTADEARGLLAGMTPGTLEVAEIRDGRLIDAAPQELAVVIHDDARAYQKPDGTWHSVVVCRGMDGPARDADAEAFAAVKRALATVAALAARVTAAEAAAAFATGERDAARSIAAGFREQCDLALAVAGEAQAARDAAEAQRAALAVARKAVVDASARYGAAWDAVLTMPPTAAQSEEIAAAMRVSYEAQDALSVALDALLRGAPGGYVRASVVRDLLARYRDGEVKRGDFLQALDAALAAAEGTR